MSAEAGSLVRIDPKAVLNLLHDRAVFGRRVRVLAERLAEALPTRGTVLDLGCGDGSVAAALMALRRDLRIEGVDVLLRPRTHIPVTLYDGRHLPLADASVDYVTIIDVLHHTEDPVAVLREAARVARRGVVIKDHLLEGPAARRILRFMDWVGNRGHGVVLPYSYLTERQWQWVYAEAELVEAFHTHRLGLYPFPFSLVFERRLHFIARLVHAR
ncbi:class I SAM-dependent methyltransferase [Arsenicitalea aurantiaca]|uniref:Class I SAM-dependent methyltransferase n=1 Tax=Arsenicitalea aurantiaca TaxID=1783274 RepID=A0A433XLH3_9HYPH|nr:class I SAM-dependent methyltransferase [Arsenicitalea aurantiaca]RUT34911.1 class I SAM-dependent methyltransferase [Arsenicitalea aurantiaca]